MVAIEAVALKHNGHNSFSSAKPTADQTADPANAIGFQTDILHKLAYNRSTIETAGFQSATVESYTIKLPSAKIVLPPAGNLLLH